MSEPPAWHDDAACKESDLDFFPGQGGDYRGPRAVCATCLVREECLAYALEQRIPHGIWGGLTESQRQKIRIGSKSRVCSACRAPFNSTSGRKLTCSPQCAHQRHLELKRESDSRRKVGTYKWQEAG